MPDTIEPDPADPNDDPKKPNDPTKAPPAPTPSTPEPDRGPSTPMPDPGDQPQKIQDPAPFGQPPEIIARTAPVFISWA